MDIALDILKNAFGDCLWLVTGESSVDATVKAYCKNECKMTSEDAIRITKIYNRPLESFERDTSEKMYRNENRQYVRLRLKKAAVLAA